MKTRKYTAKIFIISLVLIFCTAWAAYGQDSAVTVYVGSEKVEFDVEPFIENGRTMVPLRGVFEKLGTVVDWNKSIQEAVIKDEYNEIQMLLGKNKVMVNGEIMDIDVPTKLINSRTFVPLRFISENLGHDVSWDQGTRTVRISAVQTPPKERSMVLTVGSRENLLALMEYNSKLYSYIWTGRAVLTEDAVNSEKTEAAAESPQQSGSSGSADYSETNVQVEGVQEGDIIKNDGKHIFVKTGEALKVIDANPSAPKVVATVNVPENTSISEVFLWRSKLVVIGQNNFYYIMKEYDMKDVPAADYIMPPRYYEDRTNVLVYSIENPEKPVLERELLIDGNYLSGREIGGYLYLVNTKYINLYYENPEIPVPYYTDVLKNEKHEFDWKDIRYFPNYIDSRYMYTAAINLNDKTVKPDVDVYLGGSDTLYVSSDNMFAAVSNYSYDYTIRQDEPYNPKYTSSTVLYKFGLKEGAMDVKGQGQVPGTIINQFSMDEHDGMFRIATTTGQTWGGTSENNLYILDGNLKMKGRLEGLAPGESIYSTRFVGDRIYMVTFRQVDPLYVIDASDPANPKAAGMLKIPGYSTYLHMVDENHILGFGYNTEESQWGTVTAGIKLSMFDVTNITSPKETYSEIIGRQGTYSELLYNHKALMFSLSKGLMAFPLNRTVDNYKTDFNGAYVYNVNNDSISFKLKISHAEGDQYYGNEIQRIIYIGDYLYTFSQNKMQIHSINTNKMVYELNIY